MMPANGAIWASDPVDMKQNGLWRLSGAVLGLGALFDELNRAGQEASAHAMDYDLGSRTLQAATTRPEASKR